MEMDLIRNGRFSYMRLHRGSSRLTRVRWYRCAPTAQVFPYAHATTSNWLEDRVWMPRLEGIGEVEYLGYAPSGTFTPPPGTEFHGQADWFLNGIPAEHWNDPPAHCVQLPSTFCLLEENLGDLLIEASPGCIAQEHP
jgi:hypothetical protein